MFAAILLASLLQSVAFEREVGLRLSSIPEGPVRLVVAEVEVPGEYPLKVEPWSPLSEDKDTTVQLVTQVTKDGARSIRMAAHFPEGVDLPPYLFFFKVSVASPDKLPLPMVIRDFYAVLDAGLLSSTARPELLIQSSVDATFEPLP